eukprot:scaffold66080_cov42-Phaeocystis_antarctica.AAC.1
MEIAAATAARVARARTAAVDSGLPAAAPPRRAPTPGAAGRRDSVRRLGRPRPIVAVRVIEQRTFAQAAAPDQMEADAAGRGQAGDGKDLGDRLGRAVIGHARPLRGLGGSGGGKGGSGDGGGSGGDGGGDGGDGGLVGGGSDGGLVGGDGGGGGAAGRFARLSAASPIALPIRKSDSAFQPQWYP